MPKALQCPACQRKTPLTVLGAATTFECPGCGRALKVPAQLREGTADAASRTRSETPRPDGDRTTATPTAPPPPSARGEERTVPPPRLRVAWPLRVFAWAVAIPVGAVAVWVPARQFGFLSGQRLLDVLVGSGWGRYGRVLAIVPLWALVTSLIVQLLLLLFRKLGDRRRAIRLERTRTTSPADDGPDRRGRRRQPPPRTRRQRARA